MTHRIVNNIFNGKNLLSSLYFPYKYKTFATKREKEKTSLRLRLDWAVNSQKNKEQWTSVWSVGPIEQVDEFSESCGTNKNP